MKKIRSVFWYLFLFFIGCIVIFPVFIVLILPFQSSDELSKTIDPIINFVGNYVSIDYYPQYPTLKNFRDLLFYTPEFYKVFWNSILIVVVVLFFQLLVSIPSAWAFAQFKFKFRDTIFNFYVIFMLIPFQVTMLSQYLVLNKFDLINTRLSIILPAIFSTMPVFLIYRGFADIPKDILDSARIDGANELQVLWNVGLPIGKNGILSCIVISFLDLWNMVEQPLAFIKDKKLYPLSLYLPVLDLNNYEMLLTASVVTLIPAAFVFIIGQDYLEQGIISYALKE